MGRAAARIRRRIAQIVRAGQSPSGLSNRSTRTRGSRRVRDGGDAGSREDRRSSGGRRQRSARSALSLQRACPGRAPPGAQLPQPALFDQALVDRAQPPLERRIHRRPERDRLAVHRPARGDHEIRVGDQRLRVDRALGHARSLAPWRAPRAGTPRAAARPAARRPAARRLGRRSSTRANRSFSKRW